MSKGIILFQSKYGATKQYVDWLVEDTGFDTVLTKEANLSELSKYDIIILAGGVYASTIARISFMKKNYEALKSKKLAVLAVGASRYEESDFEELVQFNFKGEFKEIACFYARGDLDIENMKFKDRRLLRTFQGVYAKKDPAEYEIIEEALMSAMDVKKDWKDKKYLEPLLSWINA